MSAEERARRKELEDRIKEQTNRKLSQITNLGKAASEKFKSETQALRETNQQVKRDADEQLKQVKKDADEKMKEAIASAKQVESETQEVLKVAGASLREFQQKTLKELQQ